MTQKHTQGEWYAHNDNHADYMDIDCDGNRITSVCLDSGDIEMTDAERDEFLAEAKANAKLIAAAPDLLKALHMAQQWFAYTLAPMDGTPVAEDNRQDYFDIGMVESAIKKATT